MDRLLQAIEAEERRLCAGVPADREAAVVAVVGAIDRLAGTGDVLPPPDVVAGRRLANPGGGVALRLVLKPDDDQASVGEVSSAEMAGWADHLVAACGRLAEADLVARHIESGVMRIAERAKGGLDAWVVTRRPPAAWVERADIDWWARSLRRGNGEELRSARAEVGDGGGYDRLAAAHLARMAYQIGLPDDAMIDGSSVATYRRVLGWLLAWALRAGDRGDPPSRPEHDLVGSIASALGLTPTVAERTVAAFTVDRENAAYHAAVPGVAPAPVVRVGADRLACSLHGLTSEPLLFLTRELRRRAPQDYHNATQLKEGVFRQELSTLFSDRRFVNAPGPMALRRERGDLRTDIDAAVFDRRTGTLAVFELKSLDPFARSAAELARQRDTVMYANRQVSGVLTWLQRHGPDELLDRVDHATAKRFRVQKVLPLVLGRYLVHFGDGPEPDRRAAWGSWPQVLRLLGGEPVGASEPSPLASLFTRLRGEADRIDVLSSATARELVLGDVRLVVHASYAAYRETVGGEERVGRRGKET